MCLQETQCSIDAESKWENLTRGGWGGCGIKKISRKNLIDVWKARNQ